MAVNIPLVTAGLGLTSALGGLLGGNNSPAAPPPVYQPQNSQGADTGAYSGTQNLSQYNTAGTALRRAGVVAFAYPAADAIRFGLDPRLARS